MIQRLFVSIVLALVVATTWQASPTHAQSGIDDLFRNALDRLLEGSQTGTADTGQAAVEDQVPVSQAQMALSFAPLVKRVAPAVVNVYAARTIVQRTPFAGDPFFEQFFGRNPFGPPQRRNQSNLGSGVIVEKSGIVITNHHVIQNADEVKVALADGREFESEIMLKDEKSDLAVLRIDADEEFPVVSIGNSEDVEVGDLILAIGNPFGVGQTVTSGIVSALARSQLGISDFGFFIQTDAAINPGNSGGALVDMSGRLIGINTAIFSRSGGSNGIGFAVPSNMVAVVLRSIASGGDRVTRPWIGATFQNVSSDIADSLGLDRPGGAMVIAVAEDGPAERAGLKLGDVVLAVNDQAVEHPDALGYRLATVGVGNVARFEVLTRRERRQIDIELAAAPETTPRREMELGGRTPFAGARIANLSPAVAEELDMDANKKGVVVTDVPSRSLAARYGLRRRDIIRSVNGREIVETRQLASVLEDGAFRWQFVIERNGQLLRQFIR